MKKLLPILLVLTGCAMRAQQSFPGINITPNPAGTAGKIQMRTGANVNDVYMQQGTSAQGMVVASLLGTVSMSTESVLPILDATSIVGDGTHRYLTMEAENFISRLGSGLSTGCQQQKTGFSCITAPLTTTYNVTQSTGQILSNVLAGSGTVCLQTDNSGNIGKAAAACATPGANTTLSNLGTTAINASLTPATDNAIGLGSGAKRFISVEAAAFIARPSVSALFGCQMLGTGITCDSALFTTKFSASATTGAILSASLGGSGTRCLQTDNAGNITIAANACLTTGITSATCSAWTNGLCTAP